MIKPVIGRPPEAIEMGVALLKSNPSGCFGPWLLAVVGTSFMLGILLTQATKYFSAFGYESHRIFTIVISCIILSVLQWVVIILATWDWFIIHFGDWSRFAMVPWHIWAVEIITRLTVFVAQIFFAQRCYALYDRSKVVFACILVGMLASLVLFALVSAVEAIDPYNVPLLEGFMIPALCISLATDVLITVLTLWKLGRYGKSFSPNTDDVLQRLRNVTIEAAAPPAIAAFFNFALCFQWKNFAYHWFGLMAPKLYVWSLMFTLNSRVAIREQFNSPNENEDEDRAGTLSTGFEFARFSRLNRKSTHADSGRGRATFVLSALSRPPQATSIVMTEEESTMRDVQDEMLRSKDSIDSNSKASKNRQEFDLNGHNLNSESNGLSDGATRHARRNSEPLLTSSIRYLRNPLGER